jgi:hypothetical protein
MTLNRRSFLSAMLAPALAGAAPVRRPNIVFLLFD